MDDRQIAKVVGASDREPIDVKQPRSPRNHRVSIVVLRAENKKQEDFDRLPNFLERANATPPTNGASGETLEPGGK